MKTTLHCLIGVLIGLLAIPATRLLIEVIVNNTK